MHIRRGIIFIAATLMIDCHSPLANGISSVENPAVVMSPDGHEYVSWYDISAGDSPRATRIITFVDILNQRMLFSRISYERYTDAKWNGSSDRCAIFDAPDNANTDLWLFERRPTGGWQRRHLDPFDLIERQIGTKNVPNVARGGIESLEWKSRTELAIKMLYNSKLYLITINSTANRYSSNVIPFVSP